MQFWHVSHHTIWLFSIFVCESEPSLEFLSVSQRHVTCIRACQPLLWGLYLPNSLYAPVASGLTLYLCSLNHLLLVHNWSIFFWLWDCRRWIWSQTMCALGRTWGLVMLTRWFFLVQILNLNPSMVSRMVLNPLTQIAFVVPSFTSWCYLRFPQVKGLSVPVWWKVVSLDWATIKEWLHTMDLTGQLSLQGRYEESIRYYVRALAMNPKADNAWQYLRISLRCYIINPFYVCQSFHVMLLYAKFFWCLASFLLSKFHTLPSVLYILAEVCWSSHLPRGLQAWSSGITLRMSHHAKGVFMAWLFLRKLNMSVMCIWWALCWHFETSNVCSCASRTDLLDACERKDLETMQKEYPL